jgi:hypothetical protein
MQCDAMYWKGSAMKKALSCNVWKGKVGQGNAMQCDAM